MATVVAQDVAPRWVGIVPRHQTATDEEVRFAVTIEITDRDGGFAGEHRRQGRGISDKPTVSLIDVQPVLKQERNRRQFISTAHHVEVGPAVAVGVEEARPPILILWL